MTALAVNQSTEDRGHYGSGGEQLAGPTAGALERSLLSLDRAQ